MKVANLAKAPMISIVDDDKAIREATRGLVRSLGYSAATFASAEDYLHSDRVEDTLCLIADVQMPGMNGMELQERLIADGRGTKVIFMTGFSEEGVRARVLKSGAIGFLKKPFDDACLIKCLDRALGGKSSQTPE